MVHTCNLLKKLCTYFVFQCIAISAHTNLSIFVNVTAGQKPGYASVEVFTEDKAHSLGTTKILYLSNDKRRKEYQQLVHDRNRQSEFFHEWAASRGGAGGSMAGSPSSSSLGKSFRNIFNCWLFNVSNIVFKVDLEIKSIETCFLF